ncbi:MAG: NAD(P)/FAD-dependent oxidoreductase, partial [Gammaproteobacteria bacterium]|nr:NAD(P)/FAD-dependent oxidoreductase [Gammaproteobacteria bacterium]
MIQISILGTGFAAVTALQRVRALDPEVNITLIGEKAEFIYLPSL